MPVCEEHGSSIRFHPHGHREVSVGPLCLEVANNLSTANLARLEAIAYKYQYGKER